MQGIFFAKKVVGHNFWTGDPTDLRLTFLSCIFDGLFGDTPLDHIFSHMGQIPQDGENEQYVALFLIFEALLWPNGWTFSSFINCSEEILSCAP